MVSKPSGRPRSLRHCISFSMTLNMETTLRRQLSKQYEHKTTSGKQQRAFHFCASTFPYVTEISSISMSSVLDARAISRARTSSQPYAGSQGQRRFSSVEERVPTGSVSMMTLLLAIPESRTDSDYEGWLCPVLGPPGASRSNSPSFSRVLNHQAAKSHALSAANLLLLVLWKAIWDCSHV